MRKQVLSRRQPTQALGLETLEDRTLLAGDIIANVVQGSLVLTGDHVANGVAIRAGADRGQYIIAGLPAGGSDTSINGVFDAAIVSGVTRGLRAGLGPGDDVFRLHHADVRGNVSVLTGLGDDQIEIGGPVNDRGEDDTRIRLGLSVGLGPGDDTLRVGNALVGHRSRLDAGPGADDVNVANSRLGRFADLQTGPGEDSVNIRDTLRRHLEIDTGLDDDTVRVVDSTFASLAVRTHTGDDAVAIIGVTARNAALSGGRGVDQLTFRDNTIRNLLRVGFEPGATADTITPGKAL